MKKNLKLFALYIGALAMLGGLCYAKYALTKYIHQSWVREVMQEEKP